jgi:hypothetical protein
MRQLLYSCGAMRPVLFLPIIWWCYEASVSVEPIQLFTCPLFQTTKNGPTFLNDSFFIYKRNKGNCLRSCGIVCLLQLISKSSRKCRFKFSGTTIPHVSPPLQ